MRQIPHRGVLILCVVLALAILPAPGHDVEDAPTTATWQDLGVVRVDHRSRRLFVVAPEGTLASQRAATAYLGQIAGLIAEELPAWGVRWNVSFFASIDFAGYKTEFAENEEPPEGWHLAYLAEFDRETGRLTYTPTSKDMKHDVIELK